MSDYPKAMADVMADEATDKTMGLAPDRADSDIDSMSEQMSEQSLRPVIDDEARRPIDEKAKALALAIAEAADDRKAGNITILQTGDISYLADYFVIATGFSKVQVRAIANSIEGTIQDQLGQLPIRVEGMSEGRWVLQDYGDVIVHIFMPDDREFYDLEAFWGHAERIAFTPSVAPDFSGGRFVS
ncbi:MAG: ribosome silencing factor YbeB [Phormidesmis priestleyi Ana]|uniref:Ribosomal silencing factor RsfS n=1 Tax=Phormidesmis priestleyi Ana TaxID=1666911 RepID=A0A0N8KNP5_9CYAN|nr:MAG: ribosome silencing factor YbeB [Phormidesmis priestleyi Ana]